jgi:hypothetical protein
MPRGWVVVRRRTMGVEKSPLLIPIGPLRSRGTAARGRAPAFAASTAFGVPAARAGGGVVPSAGRERPS